MRVTMKEYLQGSGISGVLVDEGITVTILVPDETYEVSEELGKWILDNGKGLKSGTSKIKAKTAEAEKSEEKTESATETEGSESAEGVESASAAAPRRRGGIR